MDRLTYTLITDGSSDTTLIHVINWCLRDLYPELPIESQYADFSLLSKKPANGDVRRRIELASKLYPCDLLIYHRDAEKSSRQILDERKSEILDPLDDDTIAKVVCVIPIRMMESWLLTSESAIKIAANNPNGNIQLNLPSIRSIESLSEPKDMLHGLLVRATENNRRRLRNFNVDRAVHLVAEYTESFEKLRQLSAFNKFEQDLKNHVDIMIGNRND